MTRSRPRLVLAVAAVAVGATAAGVTAAVLRTPDSHGVSRVEIRTSIPWQSECESDSCVIVTHPIEYTTPMDQPFVDVTVTVTLDYRTSRGDPARAGLSLDDGSPPSAQMRPSYPLAPSHRATTTTLTWIRRNVRGSGRHYTFWLSVAPGHGNDDGRAAVSGRRRTIVIESWTAGD